LAARIQQDFSVGSELIRGDDGIFDVVVDGDRVFSKHESGRFPSEDEIAELLKAR
jgi:selenoprotein W-related protein